MGQDYYKTVHIFKEVRFRSTGYLEKLSSL